MRLIDADDLPISSIDVSDVGYYVSKYGQGIPAVYWEDIKDAPTIEPDHIAADERKIADLHKIVNYLLSQPEQRWIPVTERLPEEDGCYLGTDHNGEVVRYVFNMNESSREFWYRTVVAWMPLPEPYAERKEDASSR